MSETAGAVEWVAVACHQLNRAWCVAHGDKSQVDWSDAPEWQRESAIQGVLGALNGAGPERSHESWLEQKKADGWVYGETKDPAKKTHPCMVGYGDLPEHQKAKDGFFVGMVHQMARVIGLEIRNGAR